MIHGAEEIIDTDKDGLPDEDETSIHNTDPFDPDSDDDNLMDGYEIFNSSTSPIDSDTDDDLLNDGQEVLIFSTNPLQDDTDSDGLSDGTEVLVTFSNPLVFDDDGDSDGGIGSKIVTTAILTSSRFNLRYSMASITTVKMESMKDSRILIQITTD